jgi:hypothetical protein
MIGRLECSRTLPQILDHNETNCIQCHKFIHYAIVLLPKNIRTAKVRSTPPRMATRTSYNDPASAENPSPRIMKTDYCTDGA